MKKICLYLGIVALLSACNQEKKWEYKEYVIEGSSYEFSDYGKMLPCTFDSNEAGLNKMGKQGWELVSSYPIIETVHPNFGDSKYVTGLKPNVRTAKLVFIY